LTAAVLQTVREFYGANPRTCPDVSRIINERHTQRIAGCGMAKEQNKITSKRE
jgi:hypothetical protein